jgi:hypothetical protein
MFAGAAPSRKTFAQSISCVLASLSLGVTVFPINSTQSIFETKSLVTYEVLVVLDRNHPHNTISHNTTLSASLITLQNVPGYNSCRATS